VGVRGGGFFFFPPPHPPRGVGGGGGGGGGGSFTSAIELTKGSYFSTAFILAISGKTRLRES